MHSSPSQLLALQKPCAWIHLSKIQHVLQQKQTESWHFGSSNNQWTFNLIDLLLHPLASVCKCLRVQFFFELQERSFSQFPSHHLFHDSLIVFGFRSNKQNKLFGCCCVSSSSCVLWTMLSFIAFPFFSLHEVCSCSIFELHLWEHFSLVLKLILHWFYPPIECFSFEHFALCWQTHCSKASEMGKAVRFETGGTRWSTKWEHRRINLQQRIALRNVMDFGEQHWRIMHQSKPHLKWQRIWGDHKRFMCANNRWTGCSVSFKISGLTALTICWQQFAFSCAWLQLDICFSMLTAASRPDGPFVTRWLLSVRFSLLCHPYALFCACI